jgi:hypothetical protein
MTLVEDAASRFVGCYTPSAQSSHSRHTSSLRGGFEVDLTTRASDWTPQSGAGHEFNGRREGSFA